MTIKKVIEIPFGACSETIIWTVGEDHCITIGTYPEPKRTDLAKDNISGKVGWRFLAEYLAGQIKH